jgi:hypothetical protein
LTRTLDFLDMLRLQAQADKARCEIAKAGNAGDDTKQQRWGKWPGAFKDDVEHSVGEDLHTLCVADGVFAIVLYASEVVQGGAAGQ